MTLADSAPVSVAALQSACEELAVTIPADADLRECVGPPFERTLPLVLGPEAPVDDIIHTYRSHYMKVAPTQTMLMPDALAAVKCWNQAGIRVGIVSYKPLPLIRPSSKVLVSSNT